MILSKHCPSPNCHYFVAVSLDQKEGDCTCGCKFRVVRRGDKVKLEQTNAERNVLIPVLKVLYDSKIRLCARDLVFILRYNETKAYKIVRILEENGLIRRSRSWRAKYIELTGEGIQLVEGSV